MCWPGPGAQLRPCAHYWRCAPRRSPEGNWGSHHVCTTGYLEKRLPVHHETCRKKLFYNKSKSRSFTVLVDGVDGRPADRHLLQLLLRRGGDVVPAVSCRGRHNTTQQKRHSLQRQIQELRIRRTCRALGRDGASVKGRTVLGDAPHLAGGPDGDGLEWLVSPNMEPWWSLRQTGTTSLLYILYNLYQF